MDKLAMEYGGGLFELAEEEKLSEQLLDQVRALAAIFKENPGYARLMDSHSVTRAEKTELIRTAFDGRIHPYLYNFVCLMADRGYFSSIPACFERFEECYRQSRGIIVVKVTSAVALTEEQKSRVQASVERKTGKRAEMQCVVDPDLIAGLRVEADGKLFENSAKSKFEEIRRLLQTAVTGENT
ncbi:MAG: ATP synthase F1 subunit delta [Clostridia bacterium]|nr:ATP synthase F1 subunit delta [Clostridia bacterium]